MCRGECEDESAKLAALYNKTEDRDAFARIYELNWRFVRNYARKAARLWRAPRRPVEMDYGKKQKKKTPITQDESRLSDICSAVWLATLQGIRRFNRVKCFKSWILGITRNKAVDDVREHTKRKGDVDLAPLDPRDEREIEASAREHERLREDLDVAFQGLTEDEKRVVFMRFFEELTQDEIARGLGVTGSCPSACGREKPS